MESNPQTRRSTRREATRQPFESILAYASLEDEAFIAIDQAASLARQSRASLTVVSVLPDAGRLGLWRRGADTPDCRGILERGQRELLEAQVARLRDEDLDVRVEIRWGTPWLELIHCVLRDGHDLVVKTAEGAARGRGLFFGSTALHLVRKCPCPVWVVSGSGDAGQRRVLAAIDPTEDETRSAIAQRILNLAISMAGEGGDLHVASAWQATGETLIRSRIRPEELAEYVRFAKEDAHERLGRILATSGDAVKPERVHLVKGDPREVLPDLVRTRELRSHRHGQSRARWNRRIPGRRNRRVCDPIRALLGARRQAAWVRLPRGTGSRGIAVVEEGSVHGRPCPARSRSP